MLYWLVGGSGCRLHSACMCMKSMSVIVRLKFSNDTECRMIAEPFTPLLICHLWLLQADKLKAALIQYKQSQPVDATNEHLNSDAYASQHTPDVDKDVAQKASLTPSRIVTRSSEKSTPQFITEVNQITFILLYRVFYDRCLWLRQARLARWSIMFSTCLFVRPSACSFIRYQTWCKWSVGQGYKTVNFGVQDVKVKCHTRPKQVTKINFGKICEDLYHKF